MKKSIIFTLLLSLTTIGSLEARTYSQAEVDEMAKKISKLEQAFKDYKQEVSSEIDNLYDRADQNEFEATTNRIKWGGKFEADVNNYKGKTYGTSYSNSNKWTTKLKLSMSSKINEKTKFSGKLAMYKNWADSTPSPMGTDDTTGKKSNSGTSTLFVERAYIDYQPVDSLTITVGRQPSSDGPGMSLKNDTPRKATYPALLFDGAADGVVVTKSIKHRSIVKNIKVRAAYGKGFQKDDSMNGFLAHDNNVKDLVVSGAFAEWSFNSKKMGDNLVVLSYVKAKDFVGSPLNVEAPNNVNLGDIDLYGVHFENNKAFGTNLNYFVSYGHSKGKPNGKTVNYGPMTGFHDVGLIDDSAHAIFAGVRYDFKKVKIGYEYNKGSKNWFSFTNGTEDPMNKLATRGKANDFYLIYNIDKNQKLRFGYTKIDYDYSGSGWHIGTPMKSTDTAKRAYVTYSVIF